MNSNQIKCKVNQCKRPMDLVYYGSPICEGCWAKHCKPERRFDLKKLFKLGRKDGD